MIDLKYFRASFKDKTRSFFIAGTDEVGRGPLAGPVVASCVSLRFNSYDEQEIKLLLKEWTIIGVNDSKKLNSRKRQEIISHFSFTSDQMMVNQIYTYRYSKNMSLNVLIKEISPQCIDEINILNASLKAIEESVTESCDFNLPGLVLIDGNKKFKSDVKSVELVPVTSGDSKSLLIGLASIFAKEYRDQLMASYCEQYPGYLWKNNAGYGTAKHLEAILRLGVTEIHRKSFRGVREVYEERGCR